MNKQDNYTYEEALELTKQGIEIWRRVIVGDIVFDYEVSNLGRVKSLKGNRGVGKDRRVGYGILGADGYMKKHLHYIDENGNNKRKTYRIHRLVAIMFIPNPSNKPSIDHLDTNRTNNRVDNLHWVTQRENMNNDKTKVNLLKPVVVLDRNENIISNGLGVVETAKHIGISGDTLSKILKSHKPYKAPSRCYNFSKERLEHLKTLDGIQIMYYEDYLKEHKND